MPYLSAPGGEMAAFIKDNRLDSGKGDARIDRFSVKAFVAMEGVLRERGVQRVLFNVNQPGYGFHAPVDNLAPMYKHARGESGR
jgi:hypothetical protein